jgi:hypothetical protein
MLNDHALRVMRDRNIYRQIAYQYQIALERILDIKPLESAGKGDLSLALGEIRKIAAHALSELHAEEELLRQNQERR